jgi:DNA-binding MarR family transcriptional regulator
VGRLTERHFAGLLAVRSGIAAFERISEREAREAGATHAQHHVMLSLRGHGDPAGPTVKDVAAALAVSSPSAVELIARMVAAGLLERHSDPSDARVTRVRLTERGEQLMNQLSESHLPRLRDLTTNGVAQLAD